ncbi:BGTF surface domain-containing protein [Halomicrobium sp. HM KBTZ05]|uniref:BGTF surface domain-containing protein n=1 Tax=Halomicrobium sp. HM KBTZ05 TaxID=3242663 RepID=UPI003558EE30
MRRLATLLAALLVGSAIAATPAAAAAETTTAPTGTTAPSVPFDYEGDNLTLSAGYGQQVTGQLDRPAGTEVSVALRSEESDQPFLRRDSATVQDDGSFAVQFDLSVVEPDSDAVAILYADGERIANQSVHIESCGDACTKQSQNASDGSASSTDVSGDGNGVRLADTLVSVRNGETAAFDVQFGDADTATVSLSTEGPDGEPTWEIVATVRDTDDDGTATVQFDTAAAGSDAPTLTADDELTITRESSLSDDALDPAEYALAVDDGTEIDEPESIGTVAVMTDIQNDDTDEGAASAETGDANASDGVQLNSSIVSVRNGETAAFDVQFGDADAATVSLSTEGTDGEPTWEVVATVRDTDDDGTATVQFDTAAVGSDAPTLTADDELTITRESSLSDDALDPASYDLAVDDGTEIDDPESIGTVAVTAGTQDSGASERDETDAGDTDDEEPATESQDNVKNASIVGGGILALLAVLGVGLRLRD